MLSKTQRDLEAVKKLLQEEFDAAQTIIKAAADENRDRTPDEDTTIAEHMTKMDDLRKKRDELERFAATEKEVADLGTGLGAVSTESGKTPERVRAKSLGEQLIDSEEFKAAKAKGFAGQWKVSPVGGKTVNLLDEAESLSDTDSVGGVIPPDRQPGVLGILSQQPTVADLLDSSPTSSNVVSIITQTTRTDASDVVGEANQADNAGTKPEDVYEFDTAAVDVETIAHLTPVTNQFLEDAPALVNFVNGQMVLGVRQREELYILDALFAAVTGANQDVVSDAQSANDADHIYAGITAIRLAFQEPTGIIVNPNNWASLRLLKDGNDQYIAGSPFSNSAIGQPMETLFGKPVVITQSVQEGKALVVTRSAATVYRRTGVTVETSNSHDDFFAKNKTMIRAEERLAVGVWRPDGIATIDLIES